MRHATTIVPIGTFTPDLWQRVRDTAFVNAQRGEVIISLHSMRRHWWNALNELAESLPAVDTPYPIRLARALPRTRALLRELGIENTWFVNDADITAGARILICASRPHARGMAAALDETAYAGAQMLGES